MPGTPPTTPNLGIPRYHNNDPADFSLQVNAISDMVDTKAAPAAQGWVTVSGDLEGRLEGGGVVRLRGTFINTGPNLIAANVALFTLPLALRPPNPFPAVVVFMGTPGTFTPTVAVIQDDGQVAIPVSTPVSAQVTFDGLTYTL